MTLPQVIGSFGDKENPDTTFCIAMEDMTLNYSTMNMIDGIDFDDATELVKIAAKMHANYWESPVIYEDWLNQKDENGKIKLPFLQEMIPGFLQNREDLLTHLSVQSRPRRVSLHLGSL